MKVRCAWCGRDLGEQEPLADSRYTHGICEACSRATMECAPGPTLGEYLDQFDEPVAVVDEEMKIVAVNRSMSDYLGEGARSRLGLQGGAVVVCSFGARRGGCGNAIHCRDCAIRTLVEDSLANRCSSGPIQAALQCGDTYAPLLISTRYIVGQGPSPMVVVQQIPAPGER